MRESYRRWLQSQKYVEGTVQAQLYRAGRVEEHYGDLDQHYDKDRLEGVLAELRYSVDDAKRSKPNPSKIPINGDLRSNLASYRDAVARYRRFRTETSEDEHVNRDSIVTADDQPTFEDDAVQLFGLERDMQAVLRQSIEQLEEGLVIADDGAERSVASGFIDILAKDSVNTMVVIELKTGTARQKAVAQILSYMGDISEEESTSAVRGILIAGDFDKKARAAARVVPNLSLRTYSIHFTFSDGGK
jgi:hypothetical protein